MTTSATIATDTSRVAWPSLSVLSAYFAAAIFTAASGAMNMGSAWNKGTDGTTSATLAAVSLAVTILYTLSWPAFFKSFEGWDKLGRAGLILIGLMVTGSYSVASALGTAAGGRLAASSEAQAHELARTNAKAAVDKAEAELKTLIQSRPVATIQAEITSLKAANPKAGDCTVLDGPVSRAVCPKIVTLEAEADHTKRRNQLETDKAAALKKLEDLGPVKHANTDAAAIMLFAQVFGYAPDAESVNKLLMLLTVIVIECGGGISLAVAMVLRGDVKAGEHHMDLRAHSTAVASVPAVEPMQSVTVAQPVTAKAPPASSQIVAPRVSQAVTSPATKKVTASGGRCVKVDRTKSETAATLLELIGKQGGTMAGSARSFGKALGVSHTQVGRLLTDLAGAGRIVVEAGRSGTTVHLVGA